MINVPTQDEIVAAIDEFLKRHEMPPSRFGMGVSGEPQLVSSIRGGRSPSARLLRKIADFMAEKDADHAAADSAAPAVRSPGTFQPSSGEVAA